MSLVETTTVSIQEDCAGDNCCGAAREGRPSDSLSPHFTVRVRVNGRNYLENRQPDCVGDLLGRGNARAQNFGEEREHNPEHHTCNGSSGIQQPPIGLRRSLRWLSRIENLEFFSLLKYLELRRRFG